MTRGAPAAERRLLPFVALGYLLFVVYGSLVPLDYHYHPWHEAWTQFAHIPYLSLGVAERADWVANIVLYVPLAFFFCAWTGRRTARGWPALSVFFVCAMVAVAVEFTQIYFPPRTVSLNDIVAEVIGSAIGIAIWWTAGERLARLWRVVEVGGPLAVRAALTLYLLAYLAISFFPYDFVVSWAELSAKLASHRDGWLIAPQSCVSGMRCAAKLGYEVLAVVPLGVLVGMLSARGRPGHLRAALLWGALLGFVTESVQLFIDSGSAQGISILTRMAGAGAGLLLHDKLPVPVLRGLKPYLRPAVVVASALYLIFLAALQGWFTSAWLPLATGLERISALHFLPFYYHYYTSEAVALVSLLRNAALYVPVGLACWGWQTGKGSGGYGGGGWAAALLGGVVALGVESSKLFLPSQRPDPTNVLIGLASAGIAFAAATWLTRWSTGTLPAARAVETHDVNQNFSFKLFAALIVAALVWATASYPLGRTWLALALLVYMALLLRYPLAWLAVIPALLPTLDLGPWSGRIFLDEFDLFVLATLAVGLWKADPGARAPQISRPAAVLFALLIVSTLISVAIGLLPLQPLDHNAFSSYLSHYNALRVSKGLFEAAALFSLLGLHKQRSDTTTLLRRGFLPGITLGLLGLIGAILWEREAFTGLLDFASPYRATGMFAAMQIGGPYIEAYLVFALALVMLWGMLARRWPVLLLVGVAVAGGAYCLLVTFARGGYLGMGVALAVFALATVLPSRTVVRSEWRRRLVPLGLGLLVVAIGAAAFTSSYARYRLGKSGFDLGIRLAHWQDSLAMIDDSWRARLFGMGVGRYPETFLLKNRWGLIPGNFRYEAQDGKSFLRLGSGDSLYLGQIVPVSPGRSYALSVDVRAVRRAGRLDVYLCEKHILNSSDCQSYAIAVDGQGWVQRRIQIDSRRLGHRIGFLPPAPVELSFTNQRAGSIIDLTRVQLTDDDGRNLVANSDFATGADRWFFTTDDYLSWRVENLPLQMLFDQGWLGLTAFVLLTVYLGVALFRSLGRGDALAGGLLAAFAGILTVGIFGSVLDSPRIALLFYLTFLLALRSARESGSRSTGIAQG